MVVVGNVFKQKMRRMESFNSRVKSKKIMYYYYICDIVLRAVCARLPVHVPFVLACLSTCRLCSPACPRAVCARLPVHVPFVLVGLSTCRLCSPACPRAVCARLPVHVPFVLACLSNHFSPIFTGNVHLSDAKKRCATLDVPGWMCDVQKKNAK